MKKTHINSILAAALISTCSMAAVAANMDTTPAFEALDQNKDGQVNAEEASQDKMLSENWSTIDKDNSGTVDRAEFSAFEATVKDEKKEMAQ